MYLIEELEMDPAVEGMNGRNVFLHACYSGKIDYDTFTRYFWACYDENIEIVKYLAEKYPNLINSVDDFNDTGLHIAVRFGKMDTLVCLIEELEMDPAVEGEDGRNVFLTACYSGNIEMVKYLAGKFPDLINSVDEFNHNGLNAGVVR